MIRVVEFTKPDTVNGQAYEVGATISVSPSIYEKLNSNGTVKDYVKQKKEKEKEEK